MSTQTPVNTAPVYTPFWPVFILIITIGVTLGWQVILANQQRQNLEKIAEQQLVMSQQAAQTEAKLQAIMVDLVELARTNSEAQVIVRKYNIKMNPPVQNQP